MKFFEFINPPSVIYALVFEFKTVPQ